jgi:diguanylate cyclase (GGDEF)-like protein
MERGARTMLPVGAYARYVGALVLCTALLSFVAFLAAFTQPAPGFIPVWPSSGVGLALLWRHGARFWPAVFVSNTVSSMAVGTPLLAATGIGWLEVLIAMCALRLLQHWRVQMSLADVRQFMSFVAALLVASSLAIPIDAVRMLVLFDQTPGQALAYGAEYFLSATFSFLIFTPLLLSWSYQPFPKGAKGWVFVGSMLALVVVGWAALSLNAVPQDRLLFPLLPIVVVCALVAGLGGASAACAVLTMVLNAMAPASGSISDTLLRSFFVLSSALAGYLLAVMFRERERTATELEFRAHHDALTGLLNRGEFEHRVNAALRDVSSSHALLYLDLDQFRVVNDTCGHAAGDQLLRDVSMLLTSTLPRAAMVARLGGDEFSILISGYSTESALAVAESLRRAINDFQFVHHGRTFWLSVSTGVVLPESGTDTFDMALADADRACYQAKEEGRNRVRLFAHSDRDIAVRRAEMDWVSRLRSAMDEKRLQLYAQPIVSVAEPKVSDAHVELLLRLADENGNLVQPMAFIPAAERYGLMPTLDRWVVEEAFALYAARAAAGQGSSEDIWAINLSGATLGDAGFPAFLKRQFAVHGLRFDVICFEITETAAINNLSQARKFMREMKDLGCRFALDDFGAGASSFSYLQNLPVDYLKIDASFVTDIASNPVKEVMVRAINQIGHVMNIETIAEGVESIDLLARLGAIGVDYAQGYAIGRPRPFATDGANARPSAGARGTVEKTQGPAAIL